MKKIRKILLAMILMIVAVPSVTEATKVKPVRVMTIKTAKKVDITDNDMPEVNIKNGGTLKGSVNGKKTKSGVRVVMSPKFKWTVTGDCHVNSLVGTKDELQNIDAKNHDIYYKRNNPENEWLDGKAYVLKNGGKLLPY